MQVIDSPRVTLLSRPNFLNAEHLGWKPDGFSTKQAEQLVEFAGRLCYMSFGAGEIDGHKSVQGRSDSQQYLYNLLDMGHGSVLEHANFSFLVEGISRSCSHEIVRHRAGFAYSQLSQRFVDESNVAFVKPVGVEYGSQSYQTWYNACEDAVYRYKAMLISMTLKYPDSAKKAREDARGVLPNDTETKIVITGNVRAWRHFLETRGTPGAGKEIRRLACYLLLYLKAEAPTLFSDYVLSTNENEQYISNEFEKV